jgi:hypothetical protein
MQQIEAQKIKSIQTKSEQKSQKARQVKQLHFRELSEKRRAEELKKKQRLASIERLQEEQEQARLLTMQRIQEERERAEAVERERQEMLQIRKQLTKEAEIQKHQITTAFQKMKLRGKFDAKVLKQFGINPDSLGTTQSSVKQSLSSSGLL